ncbi:MULTISPECIES: hypothetical protein [unclassified Phyllobacterium]|uniref:hypothetical protein n=1 Tax=unclassified Phyllobacterium TaxID=2638441 RepID=UPI003012A7C9
MRVSTQAKERLQPKPRGSRLGHRLKNIETLILHRRIHSLPEADDFEMLALAFNAILHDPLLRGTGQVEKMVSWGREFFPTIEKTLVEQLAIGCCHSLRPFSNEQAAYMAELDVETRLHLGIRMIGAMEHTKSDLEKQAADRKRISNRERNAKNRKGKVTPLDERRKSSAKAEADRLGISRATFYRRRHREKMKAQHPQPDIMSGKNATVCDTCVSSIVQQEISSTSYSYSDTQIASFFRTTDRTIRRWRKNGKLEEMISQAPGQPFGLAGAVRPETDRVAGSARAKRASVRRSEPTVKEAEPVIKSNARAEENETGRTVSDPPRAMLDIFPITVSDLANLRKIALLPPEAETVLRDAARQVSRVKEVGDEIRRAHTRRRAANG